MRASQENESRHNMEDSENEGLLPERADGTQLFSNPASSPTGLASSSQESSNRPKKRATLTPNTFRRFFTPRSASRAFQNLTPSRQALLDITRRTENGNSMSGNEGSNVLQPAPDLEGDTVDQENASEDFGGNKRRKILHPLDTGLMTPETGSSSASPPSSSQGQTSVQMTGPAANESTEAQETTQDEGRHNYQYATESTRIPRTTAHGSRITVLHLRNCVKETVQEPEVPITSKPARAVRKYHEYRNAGSLLQRELGLSQGRRSRYCPTSGYLDPQTIDSGLTFLGKIDTDRFFSGPNDAHEVELEDEVNHIIPFCVTACRSQFTSPSPRAFNSS